MGGMGPTIFFTAALAAEGEIGSGNISYSSGGARPGRRHGAEGAGNRSSNIFRITVAGQRDRGEKERNRSNTGPGGHCPTGTVTAHLNLEAKEWGALRFQIRPGRACGGCLSFGFLHESPSPAS